MATVRASCPQCGDVEMTTRQVELHVGEPSGASYAFRCPDCQRMVAKPAPPRIVDVLVAAGVRTVSWRRPAELDEPHQGPAISHDDLLAFHMALESGALENGRWVAELGTA